VGGVPYLANITGLWLTRTSSRVKDAPLTPQPRVNPTKEERFAHLENRGVGSHSHGEDTRGEGRHISNMYRAFIRLPKPLSNYAKELAQRRRCTVPRKTHKKESGVGLQG